MPAVFNAIFLLIVGIVALIAFLIGWAPLSWFLLRHRSQRAKGIALIAGIPVFAALLFAYIKYESLPSKVFAQAIGFPPPADVTGLKSYRHILGDSGQIYLSFTCSAATANRIVAACGLVPGRDTVSTSDPDGWSPPQTTSTQQTFHGNKHSGGFASEDEVFGYDARSGTAYYRWTGVD